jgi:NADPH:quinone reductase-like Zn-dependent oxidoreductase
VVGGDSLGRSVTALAADGRLALIGILAARDFTLSIIPFMRRRLSIKGVSIGHRRGFERMNKAITVNGVKPIIDSVFNFTEAPKAFQRLAQGPFGKIVIAVT